MVCPQDQMGKVELGANVSLGDDMRIQKERSELVRRLAECYKRDAMRAQAVALVCDEVLDRSGAMLGKVRKAAADR